ncbi:ictacalcin-like [Genypterus blacodes]|uniref:ictacalcin-like n=1 Tax=Genypterus blacodes TaxID=154954 RepID=UPI003F76BC1D
MAAKGMPKIQQAMIDLITTFQMYAEREGDAHTLTKNELKDLVNNEMKGMLGDTTDQAAIDRIFKDLDVNRDQTVDFKEFVSFVCCLTCMCHEFFKECK